MPKFYVCLLLGLTAFSTISFSQPKTLNGVYKDTVVTNYFRRTTGVTAADGGYSIQLTDGRVFWLFGDSFIDGYDAKTQTVPCLFQVNNAGMLQPGNDWNREHATALLGNDPETRSLIKSPFPKTWFWPVSGIQLGDTVYTYMVGIKIAGEGGTLGFDYSGQNLLAKIKFPEMKVAGYKVLQDFKGIHYGIGFIKGEDQYTYVYGIKNIEKNNDLYVARFLTVDANGLWECWDGTGWTKDMGRSVIIMHNIGSTPYVTKLKNKVLVVSSEFSMGCDQGKNIATTTSTGFTGPFSPLKTIYSIDDRLNGHSPFFYVPVAHPQYINAKNEILITYCINGYGTCAGACVNGRMDPDRYRLRGIRVPLAFIDTELK